MSEPKRLIDETDSPLERLVLQAGNHAPGGDRLRGKVLVALGVGAAVASTSKTSLAMAAGWKQAIVIGALSCVGVGSVVGYRYLSQSQPVTVAANAGEQASTGEQKAGSAKDRDSTEGSRAATETAELERAASGAARGTERRDPVGSDAVANAAVGSEPGRTEVASPKHESAAGREALPGSVEPGSMEPGDRESAAEVEPQNAEGPRSNVHVRPAYRGGGKRGARVESSGSSNARSAVSANGPAARAQATPDAERHAAERSQPAMAEPNANEVAPTTPPSTLEQELAVLDAARGALAAGRWGDAQRHLNDYARRFPRGKLGLEAEVLRIEALASSGDAEGASRRASAILKRSPNSVVAARLRRFVRE